MSRKEFMIVRSTPVGMMKIKPTADATSTAGVGDAAAAAYASLR